VSNEIEQWVATARAIEIQKAGDAQALIDWYNAGADGQINWGTAGDFDACVAIAGKHLDNPEGFCQLRHMDATGEPAGKAGGEVAKADKPNYAKIISDRKGEPTDQELYNKVKAEAKEKFAVYPSAVANGWVVQEYKRRGGTYSKTVAKGDVAGHAFHGNQYETGESGTSAQSGGSRQHSSDSAKPVAKKLAVLLHERAVKNEPEISREINETCQQTGGVRIKPEFVLKDVSSIQRKLLLDSSEYLDTAKGTVESASANIGDTVRYTIQYPTERFAEGVSKALSDFKTEGFDAIKVKNFFNDDPQNSYRGINCVFHDSTTNQLFEVQFHTAESLAMVDQVHPEYERVRLLDPTSQAYADGQAKMISMWQSVPTPTGMEGIGKYSVKKDAKMLYFYDFTKPEAGILGTATLSDGKFTNLTGIAEEYINYDRDKVKQIFKQDATDESVYDDLNGWSDGSIFCVDEQKSWSIG